MSSDELSSVIITDITEAVKTAFHALGIKNRRPYSHQVREFVERLVVSRLNVLAAQSIITDGIVSSVEINPGLILTEADVLPGTMPGDMWTSVDGEVGIVVSVMEEGRARVLPARRPEFQSYTVNITMLVRPVFPIDCIRLDAQVDT